MGFFELLAVAFLLYYLINAVLWMLIDSNVELWFKERFGQPIASLRGQVVWITGASSGIGSALAINLARHGVRLVLSARRELLLQDIRTECLQQSAGLLSPEDVLVLPMDMLDLNAHQARFDQVLEHFGTLDILVNNAGRSQRADWEQITVDVDRELFELDVFSVMHLSRIAVRYFMQQKGGRGHLAVTSSVAGLMAVPFSATYCAAKFALGAYIAALKIEQPSIDVTNFAPGPIATDFLQEAFTAKPNEKVGKATQQDAHRMTAERCGHLFAVALANKCLVSFCGNSPVIPLAYLIQYPLLKNFLLQKIGKKTMMKLRDGK